MTDATARCLHTGHDARLSEDNAMSISTLVDPADVATVEALEPQVKALMEAIRAALPACERLEKADYPGADPMASDARQTFDAADGSLAALLDGIENLRIAGGDQAALDYHKLCVRDGLTVPEACRSLLDEDANVEHLDRVEALRHYAATVTA